MDAGEYDTNTFLINNLSTIAFRIYQPVADSHYIFNTYDVEHALRSDGHLVFMDGTRRGIWCFYPVCKKALQAQLSEHLGLRPNMEVCGYRLSLVEDGSFEPTSLLRSRSIGTNINTPNSASPSNSALDARTAKSVQFASTAPGGSGPTDPDTKIPLRAVSDPKAYSLVPIRDIYEFFIKAVLSSLTAAFCQRTGAIALDHRTVLLPSQLPGLVGDQHGPTSSCSALATFRVYLTTSNSLVISLGVSPVQGLDCCSRALGDKSTPFGASILAAPLGSLALVHGVLDGVGQSLDGGVGQSPNVSVGRLRLDTSGRFTRYKQECSKLMQMRGMSPALLAGCSWLSLQSYARKPSMQRLNEKVTPLLSPDPPTLWPAVLCFQKSRKLIQVDNQPGKTPALPDNSGILGTLKSWMQEYPKRDEDLAKRKKEREMHEAETKPHQANACSPLALNRAGATAATMAAGAMYPTPPDVIQPPGVTPNFDGTSPKIAPPPHAPSDQHRQLTADALGEGWDGGDGKREQPPGPFLDGENLFGDLDGELFEGNELTDADFNFFDEQPVALDMDMDALADLGPEMGKAAGASQFLHGLPSAKDTGETKTVVRPTSPHFAKPELRHARSSIAAQHAQKGMNTRHLLRAGSGIKRQPSPFNPETVFKRIRASPQHGSQPDTAKRKVTDNRRSGTFEKVHFDPSLSLANQKYQERGQSKYSVPTGGELESNRFASGNPLTVGDAYRRWTKDRISDMNAVMARISGDGICDVEDGLTSDEDDMSDTTDEGASSAKSLMTQKRVDDDVASLTASLKEPETSAAECPALGTDVSRLAPSGLELSLKRYFTDPEPAPFQADCADADVIAIAQLLTEQAATGLLRVGPQNPFADADEARRKLSNMLRHTVQNLKHALPRTLDEAHDCQLKTFLEVQDVPLLGPASRLQPRPNGQEVVRPSIFSISAPHVLLRRNGAKMSLLPSAVAFWETLGLGPSQGSKDVVALSVFPGGKGLDEHVEGFLDRLKSVYETLRLGTFERMAGPGGTPFGLFPCEDVQRIWRLDAGTAPNGSGMSELMARISDMVAAAQVTAKNVVVFLVYSPELPSSIVSCCTAYQELLAQCKRNRSPCGNNMVLQLLAVDLIASSLAPVVLPPHEYMKLALETYDRCRMLSGPDPAPAVVLDEALPRNIEFKATTNPSENLLHENSFMHLAYAQSVDERWITAAWTDNQGSNQLMASYCLARRAKAQSTALADVLHEMWETTRELTSVYRVHWRIIVAKCGPMDQAEMDCWFSLAQAENRASLGLTIITVDTNSSLQLIPPAVRIPLSASAALYTTPASTPQPSASSPSGNNPSTPMAAAMSTPSQQMLETPGSSAASAAATSDNANAPADAADNFLTTLADLSDSTWGAVLAHRLNNSISLTELRPALASGYLIKRSGAGRSEDMLVAMEVNVVHAENSAAATGPVTSNAANNSSNSHTNKATGWMAEMVLREILTQFRGLGTLARCRGVTERFVEGDGPGIGDPRPWHVAAAEKGVRAVYQLM